MQAMQVQNHVWGPAIMTFITAAANIPINIILIKYYDFWGAALATSVARILLLILLCGKPPCLYSTQHAADHECYTLQLTSLHRAGRHLKSCMSHATGPGYSSLRLSPLCSSYNDYHDAITYVSNGVLKQGEAYLLPI